ncbi:MAG TPA: penicillin-binding protein 2 [Myxococcota bacterium]|mgnify:CR=1 FL=1|nr:penicillin-binding protein 2 [Myxococcota bacterium]HQK49614.1 penicillin-binding protein 2 [Myxococcota bacterium]
MAATRIWNRWLRRLHGPLGGRDGGVTFRMTMALLFPLAGLGWVISQAAWFQLEPESVAAARSMEALGKETPIAGRRGEILDRTGRRVLALTVPTVEVAFVPTSWEVDRLETSWALADALGIAPQPLISEMFSGRDYVRVKSRPTPEEVSLVRRLGLKDVRLETRDRRFYPNGPSLGPTLGFVGIANPEEARSGLRERGRMGLEARYDEGLQGEVRQVSFWKGRGKTRYYQDRLGEEWVLDGQHLQISVDAQIQAILDAELAAQMEQEQADAAMGVALDPETFEVLAISSLPAVDPNQFEGACQEENWLPKDAPVPALLLNPCANKVLSYPFEPGSVGKIFTVATAVESGIATLDTVLDGQGGHCMIGRHEVTDLHKVGRVPLWQAFKYSSNCAHLDLATRLGPERILWGLTRLGIGRGTGIDLPGEVISRSQDPEDWRKTGYRTAGYGYGYTATLMELATAVTTLVNGGVRRTPHLAKAWRSPNSREVTEVAWPEGVRLFSEETSRVVREAMRFVVMEPDGTGRKARPQHYTAGGKTGTARLLVPKKGYSDEAYLCSFLGFAPAESPRVVIAVTVANPKVHKTAAGAIAPVFGRVVDRVLPILGVPPQEAPESHVVVAR